jgi:hypothetical protein
MSVLTEWFEGRRVDDGEREHQRAYWWRVGVEVSCAVVAGLILAGCASPSPRSEVCTVQHLGNLESGMPVVALNCVTPEQFAEAQK